MNHRILLGAVLMLMCSLPILRFWVRREGAFLAILSLEFALYYGFAAVLLKIPRRGPGGPILPEALMCQALILSIISFACICIGYFVVRPRSRLFPRLRMQWSNLGLMIFAGIATYVLGILVFASLILKSGRHEQSNEYMVLVSDFALYGIAILFTLQLFHRLGRLHILLLWFVLIPLRMLVGLISGLVSYALGVGVTLLLLYAEVRGRFWWSAILAGCALFVVVRPAMTTYRDMVWQGGVMSGASAMQKSQLIVHLVKKVPSGSRLELAESFLLGRLCLTCTFADIIRQTPSVVPYWAGETYYPLLFKPIPRLLWPEKPVEKSGQDFAHRYGLFERNDHETSFNLPQTIEMYANFGVIGVVIGSLLFGMICRTMELMFFHSDSGVGAVALGSVVLTNLLSIESAASGVLGGVLFSMIVIVLIHMLFDAAEVISDVGLEPLNRSSPLE